MYRQIGFAVVLALTAVGPGAAYARPSHVVVASERCRGHVYRPSRITLQCFNGGFYVAHLKYSSYGGKTAKATGLFYETCPKGCGGTPPFAGVPGRITLKDLIRCEGRWYYGVVSWHFDSQASGNAGDGDAPIGPSRNCRDYGGA